MGNHLHHHITFHHSTARHLRLGYFQFRHGAAKPLGILLGRQSRDVHQLGGRQHPVAVENISVQIAMQGTRTPVRHHRVEMRDGGSELDLQRQFISTIDLVVMITCISHRKSAVLAGLILPRLRGSAICNTIHTFNTSDY